jgi:2,3-bisphosphoglycerate-independent phosphoglycerate mutase
MKYVILIIDGASGWPVRALGGRTSLEAANTPNLDRLAREGTLGVSYNVPEGMEASSAVACMSLMGFDPLLYYAGRGPIEAMAMGIELEPGQVAMRCNLVTVTDGLMESYSAGNITSAEGAELIDALRDGLSDLLAGATNRVGEDHTPRMELFPGVSFRHILTVHDGADLLETSFAAPHDITGRPVAASAPSGPGAGLVTEIMQRSKQILAVHPVNRARRERGLPAATQMWLFWPGMRPCGMPTFAEKFGGRRAALTTGVDLLRGLAIQTGVDILRLAGVTDAGDNDFAGQMAGGLASLEDHDVVFVHIEAPDEASHAGDVQGKVRAIEHADELMVPQVIARAESAGDVRLLVMPDHPTPLELKSHVPEPVPFVMWGPGFKANGAAAYSEAAARATGFAVTPGHLLMSHFLEGRGAHCEASAAGCRGDTPAGR